MFSRIVCVTSPGKFLPSVEGLCGEYISIEPELDKNVHVYDFLPQTSQLLQCNRPPLTARPEGTPEQGSAILTARCHKSVSWVAWFQRPCQVLEKLLQSRHAFPCTDLSISGIFASAI